MTTETARMFYERAVKAEAEVERLQEYIDGLPYPSDVFQLEERLAARERQLGFTEECSAHGRNYSDHCGACSISRRIARYEPAKPKAATLEWRDPGVKEF